MGMLLGCVGLGTYWCLTVAGLDLVKDFLLRQGVAEPIALAKAKFAYGVYITAGGLAGTLTFGLFCQWLGRRRAFAWAMLGGATIVPITCYLPATYFQLVLLLPLYGYFTYGFHSGFALYFPELFPTHLRGVGTAFCFHGARLLAAGVLVFSGWLKSREFMDLPLALTLLAVFYLAGLLCLAVLPETKGQRLDAE